MAWSPLQELVTLDQLKQHLKLPLDVDTEDDDLSLKLSVAHEMVMDYLTQRISDSDAWEATVDAWTADTAPKRVMAAILVQAAHLYRFRGDDGANSGGGQWKAEVQGEYGGMNPFVITMLYRFRDPAIS